VSPFAVKDNSYLSSIGFLLLWALKMPTV